MESESDNGSPEHSREFPKLQLLYEENGRIYRYFLDWRHKVMVRFAVTSGAVLFLLKGIYESEQLSPWLAVPLFVALGASAWICGLMDGKNAKMLRACEDAGAAIESDLDSEDSSEYFYSTQLADEDGGLTYNRILKLVYRSIAGLCGIAAIGALIYALSNPVTADQDSADQPATALESKTEGEQKPKSESKSRSQ